MNRQKSHRCSSSDGSLFYIVLNYSSTAACAAAILSVWEALSVGYSKHRIIFPSVYVKALHLNYIYIHIYIYS